jgi:YbbR domain-containing protein
MRAVEGMRPAWLRRRIDVRRIVTHDFPLKAVAVVIALLFWVGIMQNATPSVITVAFDGRIPVERPDNVPSGYVLRGPLGDVVVTLRGAPGVADRVALSELRATLDVNALVLGQAEPQDARIMVAPPKDGVEVIDVSPPTVSVRVERLTSRTLLVQPRFSNEPPAGTRAGEAAVAPTEVRVTGPESDVARIAAVLGTVRFGDGQTDIESPDTPAIPVDAAGVPIDGLEVEPGVVTVKVPVLPTATTRTVPVVFTLRGVVAPGYWVVGAAMDPFAVTVRGEEEVLKTLDRIETQPIDVGDLSATRTLTVGLAVPAGVTLLRPTDITVTVTVQALAGTRVFSSAIVVTGLLANHIAELDITSAGVLVAGPVPALANMPPAQVVASVDAAGRGPGTYTVDVAIRVPAGVTVQTVQPTRVTLTIKPR